MSTPRYLFSTEETAEALGMTPESVRVLINAGQIKAGKEGGVWRVPPWAIEAYVDGLVGPAPAASAAS